ncbi:MAG TPA: hypothetical protein VKE96_30905 [Vicinamibacterales bacterium]|nr:hypothetical protein [Vicinamibacterales bacterium]
MTDAMRRVRAEFAEMPGLRLTESQAQRLWHLDTVTCAAALGSLVDVGYLLWTRDRRIVRADARRDG